MAVHLIIDGYNLIRQTPELAREERIDLQNGREALLQWLAAYRHYKPHPITVVFDGWWQGDWQGGRDHFQGIEVIYSRQGEKADEVIKRLARREGPRALIISSDRELQTYAAQVGATAISAREFSRRLEAALIMAAGEDDWDLEDEGYRGPGKKGPARRLPKKLRQWRRRSRKI